MSSQVKQKDAVFAAITNVTGTPTGQVTLSKDQLTSITEALASGFVSGTVPYKKGAVTPSQDDAIIYARSVVKNWLKRDTRLNGGVKPEVKARNLGTGGLPEDVQAVFNK